jgi:hypothetical protein
MKLFAVFSALSSLNPSLVQIISSAPCSQTPSVCVLPLVSETKYHTHTLAEHNRIKLIWSPGHECIVGNETTDQLAKQGSERPFV